MNACASLGRIIRAAVSDDVEPVVLIDGIPELRLAVESHKVQGPLDTRITRLIATTQTVDPGILSRWINAETTIALPLQLSDGQTKWPVLSHGRLQLIETDEDNADRFGAFELLDGWSCVLAERLETIRRQSPDGILFPSETGCIKVGIHGNRSSSRVAINNSLIYVPQEGSGLTWTLIDALQTLLGLARLEVALAGLPRDVAATELTQPVNLTRPLAELLEALLDEYDLVIQRDIVRVGGSVTERRTERRAVRPASKGRPIQVVWPRESQPIGDVLEVETDQPASASQQWIARSTGWQVESTFNLVRGWDPSLQGQPDSEYDKDKSSDFVTYADVYRKWVLNEDGFYAQPPYNRGAAFDLNALFNATGIDPQPLAFADNLALDEWGEPLKPMIEVSVNAGADWTVFNTNTDILKDRAGIYLDPDTLPGDFLTAAKTGYARVRVTASLVSPAPVEQSRWFGNASTSTRESGVIDVSDLFRFSRVAPGSIYHARVASGELMADESNDAQAMHRWLVGRVAWHAQSGRRGGGKAALVLAGTRPLLKPGDRLMDVRGQGLAVDGRAQSMTQTYGILRSMEVRFTAHPTRGRTTRLDLCY